MKKLTEFPYLNIADRGNPLSPEEWAKIYRWLRQNRISPEGCRRIIANVKKFVEGR